MNSKDTRFSHRFTYAAALFTLFTPGAFRGAIPKAPIASVSFSVAIKFASKGPAMRSAYRLRYLRESLSWATVGLLAVIHRQPFTDRRAAHSLRPKGWPLLVALSAPATVMFRGPSYMQRKTAAEVYCEIEGPLRAACSSSLLGTARKLASPFPWWL
uniref:Secreted protein n=1 Tax=Steinernema glaseri TaxID=37863 RepID=A0A1I8AJM9_9BILA